MATINIPLPDKVLVDGERPQVVLAVNLNTDGEPVNPGGGGGGGDGDVRILVDGEPVDSDNPLPVSASIDPAGLATEAKQDDIVSAVNAVTAKLIAAPATAANQATMIAGIGAPADAAATGNGSIIGVLKQLRTLLGGTGSLILAAGTAVIGKVGLQVGGADVGSSNRVPVDLSTTAVPLPTGAATAAKQDTLAAQFTGGTSGTQTNVPAATSATPLIASNTSRKQVVIHNDSTATLFYLQATGTVSLSKFTDYLGPNDTIRISGADWTGAVSGIWSDANGNARVTEIV